MSTKSCVADVSYSHTIGSFSARTGGVAMIPGFTAEASISTTRPYKYRGAFAHSQPVRNHGKVVAAKVLVSTDHLFIDCIADEPCLVCTRGFGAGAHWSCSGG